MATTLKFLEEVCFTEFPFSFIVPGLVMLVIYYMIYINGGDDMSCMLGSPGRSYPVLVVVVTFSEVSSLKFCVVFCDAVLNSGNSQKSNEIC